MTNKSQLTQNLKKDKSSNLEKRKDRLKQSLATIAFLIEQGNENLWPVFEKLESELGRIQQNEYKLSLYSTT